MRHAIARGRPDGPASRTTPEHLPHKPDKQLGRLAERLDCDDSHRIMTAFRRPAPPFGTGALVAMECRGCGRQSPLASNAVTAADDLQVRCEGCGAVLAEIMSSPHATWLDVRGIREVRRDRGDP